jgi:arylsulfatase A-like enzyme
MTSSKIWRTIQRPNSITFMGMVAALPFLAPAFLAPAFVAPAKPAPAAPATPCGEVPEEIPRNCSGYVTRRGPIGHKPSIPSPDSGIGPGVGTLSGGEPRDAGLFGSPGARFRPWTRRAQIPSRRVAGWGLAALLCGACAPAPPPDLVLVSIDTLRADALGCYGNPRPTSPHLDALAAAGLRFAEVWAPAPNTATSHASLFTGLPPWTHRVANISSLEHGTPALHPAFVTLAEQLSAAGYQTAAVTDGGPLGESWDLLQGFDLRDPRYRDVRQSVDQCLELLADRDPARPLFLFLHTYQVHEPYCPSPEWVARFAADYDGPLLAALELVRAEQAQPGARPNGRVMLRDRERFTAQDVAFLRALYDAEVGYTDGELARLIAALPDTTALAVTSDHGEEFGEHGVFGHQQLHAETLRVPLLLRLPGGEFAGRVVEEPVRLLDLHPTLLGLAGLAPATAIGALPEAGRDLLAALRRGLPLAAPAFASTNEHLHPASAELPWLRAVRSGEHSYLDRVLAGGRGERTAEVYDRADAAERAPLFRGDPAQRGGEGAAPLARGLAGEVERHLERAARLREDLLRGAPPAPTRRDARAAVEELRALGYLEGDD